MTVLCDIYYILNKIIITYIDGRFKFSSVLHPRNANEYVFTILEYPFLNTSS